MGSGSNAGIAAVAAAGGWSASKICINTAASITETPSFKGRMNSGPGLRWFPINTPARPQIEATVWPTITDFGRATRKKTQVVLIKHVAARGG